MRRLLIVSTVPVTMEAFLSPFAEHFRGSGWRVDGLANGLSASPAAASFDRVHDITWSRNALDPSNLLSTGNLIRGIVREGGHDIVHVHTPVASFVTRWALRGLRGDRPRIVYTAHGFHFASGLNPLRNMTFLGLERLAGRWTDALVVINDEDFAAAKRHRIVEPGHVRRMHGIGIDTGVFRPEAVSPEEVSRARGALGVGRDTTLITMVAEFTGQKRQSEVLRALALTGGRCHIAFAGDGPCLAQCRELAARLGVEERTHFLGWRRDVRMLLAASEATVLFSLREGLPRSAMESLAMETPVVGPDIRGVRDLLADGCGILVPSGDVRSLAAAMDRVSSEPDALEEMGRRGRRRMTGSFSLRSVIGEHERLYADLLAENEGGGT